MNKISRSSKSNNTDRDSKSYLRFYGLAFELVIFNIIAIWGGYGLDQYLKTTPMLMLAGVMVAVIGTIKLLLKRLQ